MTDRSKGRRPAGGRSTRPTGPKRPTAPRDGGRTGASSEEGQRRDGSKERPFTDGRTRAGQGGRPTSKRAGKRPPKSVRDEGTTSWKGNEGPRPERPAGARGGKPTRPGRPGPRTEGDREGTERPSSRPPQRGFRERDGSTKRFVGRGPDRASKHSKRAEEDAPSDGRIRLNRYLSNAGVASRREADKLIQAGVVSVNGEVVTELGTKVGPGDRIHYGGQRLSTEKKRYVLLNKPKDFITTTDDPRNRRTVMALIDDACSERLYPVGRLDRHTTGVLLMTNDGDLAKKLTHPSHGAEKIYHATLDKSMTKADLDKLVAGVHLDDGPANADEASYVVGGTKKEIGLKIHMGRNRVVRRMFAALGYEVVKLDRVVFAGLTKKDLPRSKWRHLSEKEVLFLSKRK